MAKRIKRNTTVDILEISELDNNSGCEVNVSVGIRTLQEARVSTGRWPWNYEYQWEEVGQTTKLDKFLRDCNGCWFRVEPNGKLVGGWKFFCGVVCKNNDPDRIIHSESAYFYKDSLESAWRLKFAEQRVAKRYTKCKIKPTP